MCTTTHPAVPDQAIALLASRQGGVVSRAQLRDAGLSESTIRRRVAAGRLHAVPGHRAVFMVGHAGRMARSALWAAHLSIGGSSVISHRSAAALWGLRPTASAYVELTVTGPSRRRTAIRVHRTTWLPEGDVEDIDGLRVTAVARTLLDMGAVLPERAVERAYGRSEELRLLDFREIQRVLQEGAARPGAAKLRRVVGRDAAGSTLTENGLEELMLALVRRAGLPDPVCQYPVLGYRADFCWPRERLIVETDGEATHRTRTGWRRDARRDVVLQLAGWRVLRFPRLDLLHDPTYVAAAIGEALSSGELWCAP
jgi:very-short-patch-repair endonuclease